MRGALLLLWSVPGFAALRSRHCAMHLFVLLAWAVILGDTALATAGWQQAIHPLQLRHGLGGIMTASIGVAVLWPQPLDRANTDFVGLADAALYAAKAQGRNCARFSPLSGSSVLSLDQGLPHAAG